MKILMRSLLLISFLQVSPSTAETLKDRANGLIINIAFFTQINNRPAQAILLPAIKSIPNAIDKDGRTTEPQSINFLQGPVVPWVTFENKALLDCVECRAVGLTTAEFTLKLIKSGTFYGGVQKTLP